MKTGSKMALSTTTADGVTDRPRLKILLAGPRGFCAGVDRAIKIVELALKKYGAPVYVRHEIVHNKFVVDRLREQGAVFVEELSEIPKTDAPVIFSAHGVPKSVPADAEARNMFFLDATCPLVTKVHREAESHFAAGRHILLIGHVGHPEVVGTTGQLPKGAVTIIETAADAESVEPANPDQLAYATQTTLSVDDTAAIVGVLERRFPNIAGPHKQDICYATTNRQEAVRAIAARSDRVIVVGSPNSSNSKRLVEVAERGGTPGAMLIQRAEDIPWDVFQDIDTLGISAGASAPEVLVQEMVDAFRQRFEVTVEEIETATENVAFNIPRQLRDVGSS
jgi:4-hydroxy-3-methylbut-2-enyl diphosphate reductase